MNWHMWLTVWSVERAVTVCFPAVLSPTRLLLFLSGRSHYLLPWERNSLKLPSFRHSGSPRQAALPLPPPPWGLTTYSGLVRVSSIFLILWWVLDLYYA